MKRLSQGQARVEFLRWLKNYDPSLYDKVLDGAGGLGKDAAPPSSGGFWSGIADTFNKIAPTVTQSIAQAKIFRAQMKRAKKGLPPLNTAEYAPTMRIQADIAPATRNAIFAEIGSGFKQYLLPIAGITLLLGLFFIVRKKK